MSLFSRRQRNAPSTITAAARPIAPNDEKAIAAVALTMKQWQQQAWSFYSSMAEIHYPASYKGNALSRFRLHISEVPADRPNAEPVEVDAGDRSNLYRAAEDILAALEGPYGGHAELLRLYGINMAIAADCWLVGVDGVNEVEWEVLSISELRANNSGSWERFPVGGSEPSPGWKPTSVSRLWRKHPQYSGYADGPMQSLLADCERLAVLNRSMTNRIMSKLAQAGYVFIPQTMTISGAPEAPDGSGTLGTDPMVVALLAQAERSVVDGTGSFIPSVIRGPSNDGEAIRFINMDRAIDRVEMELRAELRDNIAKGNDLPPEVQQGMGSGSHWATWAVSDSSYQDHIVPDARDFVSALTSVYLRPLLRDWNAANGRRFSEADIRRLYVDGDGSAVVSRPNRSEDARQLHDRLAISDASLRRDSGADDSDIPDDDEYVRQLGRKVNNPFLATYGLEVHDAIDWDKVAKVPNGPGSPGVGSTPEARRPVDNGTPGRSERDANRGKKMAVDEPMLWAAIAEGHLSSAMKKAGAQVRARCEPHPEVMAEMKRLPNESLPFAVLDHMDEVGITEAWVVTLVRSALAPLPPALCELGIDSAAASVYADRLASQAVRKIPRSPLAIASDVIAAPPI